MQQHSKHISEFTSPQILEIIDWGKKLNLTASQMESPTTKIIYQQLEGGKPYLTEVNLNGRIINPNKI